MARTTYRVHGPDRRFQTTDSEVADKYARMGVRVTAVTHA